MKRGRVLLCDALLSILSVTATGSLYAAELKANWKVPVPTRDACERPPSGGDIVHAHDIRSKHGLLKVTLTIRNSSGGGDSHSRYCYVDESGHQSPTLRVQPGDVLDVLLKNEIAAPAPTDSAAATATKAVPRRQRAACAGGPMSASATNLHFHGLAVPPVCHQDETLRTLIQPGDPPFEYRITIPKTQPPGLYWYHPHVHGFSEEHLLGGASGALIVEGVENSVPSVRGLPERVLVIRDEWMPAAAATGKPDPNRPTKQLSLNYVPIPYPDYPPPVIRMRPGERELWRVLNASADTYVSLYVEVGGKRRSVGLVALDGVSLQYGEATGKEYVPDNTSILLPPAARAEFIITAPAAGESGRLMTSYVFRGADEDAPPAPKMNAPAGVRMGQDDVDAARPLAALIASADAPRPEFIQHAPVVPVSSLTPLSDVAPVRKRTLYFSERLSVPGDANSPQLFFITEEGREPAVFDPNSDVPNITVHQGDVEEWFIENHSRESHVFHIHQLHFIVLNRRGAGWEEPTLRDTVNVPGWSGRGKYPRLTLRMDFRDPNIIGTVPFHCHIAQHLDGGMMGTVRIEPAASPAL